MKARKGKGLFVFCCLAPAAILFIVFMILPTIDIFRMSMFKWGGYTDNKTFVGLDNFKILFKSDKFYQAFPELDFADRSCYTCNIYICACICLYFVTGKN